MLRITKTQYRALSSKSAEYFLDRVRALLVDRMRSLDPSLKPDLDWLPAFVGQAFAWGLDEEQDVFELALLRFTRGRQFFEQPEAREILTTEDVPGWQKALQIEWLGQREANVGS